MDQQNRRRSSRRIGVGGILIRAALILLCFVLLSVYLMKGMYARYLSRGEGSDSARVAQFKVDVAFEDGENMADSVTANVKYNDASGTYTIVVDNDSEVAITYDIYIENIVLKVGGAEKMLAGVTVKLDSGSPKGITDSAVTFSDAGTMAPNATADNAHTLAFVVDWDAFLAQFTGDSVTATITFDVRVNVEQVD